ncbi:conserved hypothetical protein [Talaromyces stipitatus ATCC 10500]|uniref:Metallo-beta-lactamase domain-containing protein n=1 Tax=Talaromyces stipitatus (strain ATCC 10500 / CBS 375.48 / QM 6759 / NRRL 1006) TaxID=441959 RepID=B8LUA4_TALSN|nr:uncharacterized protein TSTA_060680 [Talaromyces stipitatus ATCC 10500]EED22576.1 conserved hypothetical protein [Talaromyces stipitatus ATCC 10500]
MNSSHLASPIAPPQLNIPHSTYTVDIRVIDTETLIYLDPKLFWQPELDGFDGVHAPIYCFLISHGQQHVVFDLGVRRDWENYAPRIVSLIKATTEVIVGKDVAEVLDGDQSGEVNVHSRDISSVIWSHNHFDHIGDPSTFPVSTELVVGPGVRDASWPGYPSRADAGLLDSDADGRVVREISFESGLKIGRFDAFDFFGDGSFYLLDSPGHAIGHICGLARTTAAGDGLSSSESSFVFMGADACHHPGVLRPTEYLPLPQSIRPPLFRFELEANVAACPGEFLAQLIPSGDPADPFFTVANTALFPDHEAAMETVKKIHELDAAENILVVIAHDLSLRDRIPLFPKRINQWQEMNLKSTTRWLFCRDFEEAIRRR